ncbi:hypothetical protein A7K91_14245 [Paenibacillus oryzae]|uniref:dTDP-4-dehydrorhamnose reductase n=1 Tax=Paenibacillus oryzae TaxID=1844972 RepID=A0A1A5YK05_9BACL|nr:sugar nucleotide-binding protein [Paenibacillus oryzae]OBR65720.1 hypothetical protein A7K91_14245 [Paenibacillus oryzae]
MVHKPYVESDTVNPQSIYGKSKLAGEMFVRQWVPEHYILRTSWLFGKHGANFVKSMLSLAEQRDRISVVCDQFGSPTYTVDLSEFIVRLLDQKVYGTYHVSNTGSCSWYEFSKEIFKQSAPRPPYSVMDHMGIRLNGLQDLRNWKEALSDYLLNS